MIPSITEKVDNWRKVLELARDSDDPGKFHKRLKQKNRGQRSFVEEIEKKLPDKNSTYEFLKRFQILHLDIEEIKSNAQRVLEPDSYKTPTDVASTLFSIAWDNACSDKGIIDIRTLEKELKHRGYRLIGNRNFSTSITLLNEQSDFVLSDIKSQLNGINLPRKCYDSQLKASRSKRYIEFVGETGVGKSALGKKFIENKREEGCVVLAFNPNRTIPGGWNAMRRTIDFTGTAKEFMQELFKRGPICIFIDDANLFSKDQQLTILDLLSAGNKLDLSIAITKRLNFDHSNTLQSKNWGMNNNWLNLQSLEEKDISQIQVQELNDTEVREIQQKGNLLELNALLDKTHPASKVCRNLFLLHFFIKHLSVETECLSEESMIQVWFSLDWVKERRVRRLIRKLALARL